MATSKPKSSKKKIKIPAKKPKKYNFLQKVRTDYLHHRKITERDRLSRRTLNEHTKTMAGNKYVIGNLYLFNYFTPKTEDQLEYYDAMPCAILFGRFKTKKGEERILGFNIHYYPPRWRFKIMDKILEVWNGIYKDSWNKELKQDLDKFTYYNLIIQLQRAHLEFGIREYIPALMGQMHIIPPGFWYKAVYTEGHFRKRTRDAILNYWKQLKDDRALIQRARKGATI